MARARLLKPGFFTNAKLSTLSPHARLLFAGLWTLADREGRMKDEPLAIKGAIFPFEDVDVDALLRQLSRASFITRYRVKSQRFVSIDNFLKHQTPHVKEAASTIPAPDQHETSTAFSGTSPSVSIAVTDPISKTETETEHPPSHPFALAFVKHHQERHAGNRPSPTQHAEAVALESEHGADWCFRAAEAFDWQKPPAYLRPWIIDHKEKANANVRPNHGEQDAGADSNGVVVDLRGVEQREPSLLERRRHRVSS